MGTHGILGYSYLNHIQNRGNSAKSASANSSSKSPSIKEQFVSEQTKTFKNIHGESVDADIDFENSRKWLTSNEDSNLIENAPFSKSCEKITEVDYEECS